MKHIALVAATMAAFAFSSAAQAEDLTFTLKNDTSATLVRFHTSPVGVEEWEDDVFGSQVLEPGETIELTIADGRDVCEYDMRFEFDENSELETTVDKQDLCKLGSYTIHE
ncbi:hypothetical protein [Sinorhizobium americanum]|uniref:Uncharacterized protein n=1 Tax=Sinorhizobium americanum TaxID=194963 RepID=A0A1L3LHB4_9HYPH|nr:hypothetical protein [Sinorhizobium americanum]APG82908.1 hypothetical protein SAMCCGM7_Ch0112 [Sinorhizobium americanum CCGM7]APG89446.1 hypothetical protein SAMCFNEI73_Ch0110 [Sinorhizobium americanum]OAP36205.1 hypothetical protein ATC00_30225 [Sinorhizobium americanum]